MKTFYDQVAYVCSYLKNLTLLGNPEMSVYKKDFVEVPRLPYTIAL